MSYNAFTLSIDHQVAHLQLSRPEQLNTMNNDFWHELPSIMDELARSGEIRALVLSSTGKHFCAGMDLNLFSGITQTEQNTELGRKQENLLQNVLLLQSIFNRFEQARFPVLAATQGGCIGGAVDMICTADMRYCTEDAFFTIEEINIGMTADLGTLQRLPHLISHGLVRELAYTGRRLAAQEALSCGLVNQVFADQDTMIAEVLRIAGQIAERSPLAVHGCKSMLNFSRDHSVADSLQYMAAWQSGMFQRADIEESIVAKIEKRKPKYDDLLPTDKRLFVE